MAAGRAKDRSYSIAVIPGDGIGKEVVPEGVRVLERAAALHGFQIDQQWHDFASCDYYARHGLMMPEDWKARIGSVDAIFFGGVPRFGEVFEGELTLLVVAFCEAFHTGL